ncbi:amino acid transporter AVT1B [Lactuca sativa]|uniref:amino acid transporter AVT1B n=1 Tax=Lactuca sativa TaxID=4236 RepID=UPI000CD8B8B8|nr:amino acid transporter AVT1B [Lactuca sativa]XP_052623029.1 amino acid transporter AVT1B [Lactuca sativa]
MKTTGESDCILLVDSENKEIDEDKDLDRDGDKDFDGGDDDDSWNKANDDEQDCDSSNNVGDEPQSSDPSWPRSYRKSMDLLGTVASPSLSFLGSPPLSSLGGSFLSSSPKRRQNPKITTSLGNPLLPPLADNHHPPRHPSDHSLHSQWTSSARKSSQLQKSQIKQSSFAQAVVNGVNLLCGVALLSTPYAVKEGGWLGLSIMFIFCVLCFYTGLLLRDCLDTHPRLQTYPDIGEAAFGIPGRLLVSIVLYVELYASCVEFIILESDNISSLFPNTNVIIGGHQINSHSFFAIMITLVVLPTVWLRDLSVLSYISAGGVFVIIILVCSLFWIGLVDKIGFQMETTKMLNLSTLPVSIGMYGYCYAGHAVLPNIYMSMEKKSQYPLVILASFGICTLIYAGVAIMGYMMFGESTESQFTLNLPPNLLASKIAIWATVITPVTKYALVISPVAKSLEELIPSKHSKSHVYSILIRTALVISTLVVALSVPFFGLVMSLIGSLLSMLVSLIFPCACFLRILRGNVTHFQVSMCVLIIAIGVISLSFGTYTSISEIIQQYL